jgi:hypothetical protein
MNSEFSAWQDVSFSIRVRTIAYHTQSVSFFFLRYFSLFNMPLLLSVKSGGALKPGSLAPIFKRVTQ